MEASTSHPVRAGWLFSCSRRASGIAASAAVLPVATHSDRHAKAAAVRRQGEHLRRPDVLLADRGAHAAHHLGSVLALRARPPARVGVRRDDHDVRDAVHDGRRLHAREEQPRARRRAVRLLPAAAAGRPRPHAVHPVLHSGHRRVRLGRLHLCRRVVGDQRAFEHHVRGPADLPVQDGHPGRRGTDPDAGHRRNHPLHHLPEAG